MKKISFFPIFDNIGLPGSGSADPFESGSETLVVAELREMSDQV
jgi:hypothetical protein